MLWFKQSETTATRRRMPIRMVNDTGGTAEVTSLSIGTADVSISKNGAAPATSAGAVTEIGGGDYYYEATAGELDTLGFFRYRVVKSPARTFVGLVQVVLNDPYVAGGASPSAGAIADAVWDELRADHLGGGTFGEGVGSVQGDVTGSIGSLAAQAKLDVNAEVDIALNTAIPGGPTADSINERIATIDDTTLPAIKAKTDNLPSAPVKNQALSNFSFFLRYADGAPAPGLAATGEIGLDAGAFAPLTNAPVGISGGFYRVNLTAGEMNGDVIRFHAFSGTAEAAISFLTRPA